MPNRALDRVIRLLHEEHKYDTLPSKAVNKLLYLVHKEATTRGLDVTVPYFWYQFGVVTMDAGSGSPTESGPRPARAPTAEHEPRGGDEESLRGVVRDVLDDYYDTSLEEITDRTYTDAPYDVQQEWRALDKKLRTHHEDYNDFFEVDPSHRDMQRSVDTVYDTFPVQQFPEHESDLLDWYSIMMRELRGPELDIDRLMEANLAFWRVFSLTVAENHRHAMTKDDVARVLGIPSFETARENSRADLRAVEAEALDEKFADDQSTDATATRAADALAASALRPHVSELE